MSNTLVQAAIREAIPEMVSSVMNANISVGVSSDRVEDQVKKAVEQDPIIKSKRMISLLFAAASFILLLPGIQDELINLLGDLIPAKYLPLATILLSGLFSAISKRKDIRPYRA